MKIMQLEAVIRKKKRGWHAKQKQYNKDVKAIIMQFSLGMMHFVIISK